MTTRKERRAQAKRAIDLGERAISRAAEARNHGVFGISDESYAMYADGIRRGSVRTVMKALKRGENEVYIPKPYDPIRRTKDEPWEPDPNLWAIKERTHG